MENGKRETKKNEEVKKQLKLPEEDRETDVTKDTNH